MFLKPFYLVENTSEVCLGNYKKLKFRSQTSLNIVNFGVGGRS